MIVSNEMWCPSRRLCYRSCHNECFFLGVKKNTKILHREYHVYAPAAFEDKKWKNTSWFAEQSNKNGMDSGGDSNIVTSPALRAEFNSLWRSDAIWRHRSGSILAQVMACCLTAPSHHLNQCWLIVSTDQWRLSKGNSTRDTPAIIHENHLQFA